jgi:hypothetical protein
VTAWAVAADGPAAVPRGEPRTGKHGQAIRAVARTGLWRASASDPTSEKDRKRFRECLGVDYSGFTITGEADSKDFSEGESTSASSESAVYQSAAQAQQAAAEYSRGLSGSAAEGCLRKLLGKDINTSKAELDEIDVGELNVKNAPDVEEVHAWQIVFTFNIKSGDAKGFSPSAYLDIIDLRQGDSAVSLQASDVLSPFDSGLRDELLEKLASRMATQPAPSE